MPLLRRLLMHQAQTGFYCVRLKGTNGLMLKVMTTPNNKLYSIVKFAYFRQATTTLMT